MTKHDRAPQEESTLGGDTTRFVLDEERAGVGATGHRRACLIVLVGEEIGREIELPGGRIVLGRSAECGVRINSQSISRRHAEIQCPVGKAEAYHRIDDLGSTNGTLVNGAPAGGTALRDGDKLQLGDVLLKFVVQDTIDEQFHKSIHRLIHYDQLTGLMTMDSFRRLLDDAIRDTKPNQPFTLAMTDLDGLKKVNDTHGHLAGRMVVREMGAMIRNALRATDRAGLYGGDEAIMFYPGTNLHEARSVAETLRQAIENRVFEHEGARFSVTISQGLAEWPRHGASAEAIIAAADRALYAAKAGGRNCIRTTETELLRG